MPSISRTRNSNITFSDGEKYYDDLILNIEGKSFLIDYVNGGGKTFLAQCIMQTILPKSHFTSKHPFKELYNKTNNNNTIHCLVEWNLEEGAGYDHMITGFCSRKKEGKPTLESVDAEGSNASDVFNYVCCYNEGSAYSIDKIPLKGVTDNGDVTRLSYSALRKFIRGINNSGEENCFAQIYDTTPEYHKLLKDYKINTTEWELNKDVNRGEARLADYFDKFNSSKTFIRDFLIPKIDEASKLNNIGEYQSGDDRAESLLAIKDAILEYSKRVDSIRELDSIKIALDSLVEINKELIALFGSKKNVQVEVIKGFNKIRADIENEEIILQELEEKVGSKQIDREKLEVEQDFKKNQEKELVLLVKSIEEEIKKLKVYQKALEIKAKEKQKAILIEELEVIEAEVSMKNDIHEKAKNNEKKCYAENKYMDYLAEKADFCKNEETRNNHEKNHKEILEKLSFEGGKYKYLLSAELEKLSKIKEEMDKEVKRINDSIKSINAEKVSLAGKISSAETSVDNEKAAIEKLTLEIRKNLAKIEGFLGKQKNTRENLTQQKVILCRFEETYKMDISMENEEVLAVENSILREIKNLKDFYGLAIEKLSLDVSKIEELKNELNFILKSDDSFNENIKKLSFVLSAIKISDRETEYSAFNDEILGEINELIAEFKDKEYIVGDDIAKTNIAIVTKESNMCALGKDISKLQEELIIKGKELQKYKSSFNILDILLQKRDLSCEVYELEKILSQASKDKGYEVLKLEENIEVMQEEFERLKENKGLALSNDLINCFSKIQKKFDSVLLGTEFLKSLDETDKVIYLEKSNSLIAYSILASNSDYNKIINNQSILEEYKDSLIPIINIDALKSGNFRIYDGLYLTHRNKEEILDEERILKEIRDKEVKIESLSQDLVIKRQYLDELNQDVAVVKEFNREYSKTYEEDRNVEIEVSVKNSPYLFLKTFLIN